MKFNWQEIAEQHAARIRELEELANDLQYALDVATGGEDNRRAWRAWIHEQDCHFTEEDPHGDECRCDGRHIAEVVEEALAKRIN